MVPGIIVRCINEVCALASMFLHSLVLAGFLGSFELPEQFAAT